MQNRTTVPIRGGLGLISIWTLEQFYLQWEHNWPSNRIMCCLATGAKSLLVKIDKMFLYLYVLLSSRGTVPQSVQSSSLLFVPADFMNFTFLCVISNTWEMCSRAKMPMWHFTFSLHQVNSYCCCCCHVGVPQRKVQPARVKQWCEGLRKALRGCVLIQSSYLVFMLIFLCWCIGCYAFWESLVSISNMAASVWAKRRWCLCY